jgi:hypothetical protein
MSNPVTNLAELLQTLQPTRHEGVYVFASVPPNTDIGSLEPIATFREVEGLTLIVEEHRARQAGLPVVFRAAWITLTVHSGLQAVGLTAAVASALAQASISCNVVAAAFHDHLFVPAESGDEALAVLQRLQRHSSACAEPHRSTGARPSG